MDLVLKAIKQKPLLFTILVVTLMSVSLYWPFISSGVSYLYVVGDGYTQTWPYMVNLSDYIRTEGFPMWNFSIGLGAPFSSSLHFLGTIFFALPVLLGREVIPYIMVFMQIAKIALSALCFYLFLKKLGFRYYTCIIITIMYSFCGIMITKGGWTKYSTECFIFAFILYSLELYFKDKKWHMIPFSLSTAFFSFGVTYIYTYAILLFIYATVRYLYITRFNVKEYFLYILRCGGLYVCGVLISAVFTLPYIFNIFSTARFERTLNESGILDTILHIFSLNSPIEYLSQFYRTFSPDILGVFDNYSGFGNYLEGPLFYCTLIVLLLIPQAILYAEKKLRKLITVSLLICFVYLLFTNIKFIINGFLGYTYKFSSLWIVIVLLIIAAFALNEIVKGREINKKLLIVSYCFLVITFFGFSFFLENYEINFQKEIAFLVFLLMSIWFCIFFIYNNINLKKILFVIFIIIIAENWIFSSITINKSYEYASDKEKLVMESEFFDYSNKSIEYIEQNDSTFYRISQDRTFTLAYPLFNNFFGSTFYDAFAAKEYISFLNTVYPNSFPMSSTYQWSYGLTGRSMLETLTAHKYYIGNDESVIPYGYDKYTTVGDKHVYKNQYALPLGFAYDKYMLKDDFERLNIGDEMDYALLGSVVLDEPMGELGAYNSPLYPMYRSASIDYSKIETHGFVDVLNNLPEEFTGYSEVTDPQLTVPVPWDGTAKSYYISYETDSEFKGTAQLYWSSPDEGYSEENSLTADYDRGIGKIEFTVNDVAANYLRIDPGMAIGEYNIKNLVIKEIDKSFIDKSIVKDIPIKQTNLGFANISDIIGKIEDNFSFQSMNEDPFIVIPINDNDIKTYSMSFDVISDFDDSVQLFWTTPTSDTFKEENSQWVSYNAGEVTTINLELKDTALNKIRIDPGTNEGRYTIENLKITSYDTGAVYVQAVKDRAAEGFVIDKFSQNHITGSVDVKGDRMMFFSIPYAKGWTMFVDGVKTPIQKVNIGFIGTPLTAGKHTIELKYRTPGLYEGGIISLISVAGYVIMLINRKKIKWFDQKVDLCE